MKNIETQIAALECLHTALLKVQGMGGPGVLLPGHVEEARAELEIAQSAYEQLITDITDLGQHIIEEHRRLDQDIVTFQKLVQ